MRSVALFIVIAVAFAVADLQVLYSDSPTAIQGSYIVVLKDNTRVTARDAHIFQLQDRIAELADEESSVGFKYNIRNFVGFSAKLSKTLLQEQLTHPLVKYVEIDQEVTISGRQTGATWGLDRIDQTNLPVTDIYSYNKSAGAGVHVYVVDTGIYTAHTDFEGRASSAFNSIAGESSQDLNGHGTHCAGTVGGKLYGVAKLCTLFSVKVLGAGGSGSWAGVIAGIDYITNNRVPNVPAVASMSLGGGIATAVDDAVAASIASGVVYSIAAGNNNGDACSFSPARVPTCISVGASDAKDVRSVFSNHGKCVRVFAPGTAITSAWIGNPNAINTISGTSMACPHVSGVAALHLSSFPALTPAQVLQWVQEVATPNVLVNTGTGSPNLLLYAPHTA